MAVPNLPITILTLNVNGPNALTKDTDWQIGKKPKLISVLYPGNPTHMQGYTKAQNKGMEKDLPRKWRAKKTKVAILV